MAESRTGGKTEDGETGITAAASGENELTEGAAAEEDAAEADEKHAEEVPEGLGMCDGLIGEAEMQASVYGVADEGSEEDEAETGDEAGVTEQEQVPNAAHHAKPAVLCEHTDGEAGGKGEDNGGMERARAGFAEEDESGGGNKQSEQAESNRGGDIALGTGLGIGPAQRKALVEEDGTDADAACEAGEADQSVEVTAGKAQDHTEGTAEKDEGADHDKDAEEETGQRGGAALRPEFPAEQGHEKSAEDESGDLGAYVLHNGSAVEAQTAGDITDEAGNTEAHVGRVSVDRQENGKKAGDGTCYEDGEICGHFAFQNDHLWVHILNYFKGKSKQARETTGNVGPGEKS